MNDVRPPGMRRTRWNDLAVVVVVCGLAAYLLARWAYSAFPPLSYAVPVPLAALAVAEFVAARRVRMAVRHDPRAKPIAAIVIARCVALGKASSLVGAGVFGAAVGLLIRLLPDLGAVRAVNHDAQVSLLVVGAALLLVGAGLVLERAGIDPGSYRRRDQ